MPRLDAVTCALCGRPTALDDVTVEHDCETAFTGEFVDGIDAHLQEIAEFDTRRRLLEASQAANVTLAEDDLDQMVRTLADDQVDVPALITYGDARILTDLRRRIQEFDEDRRQSAEQVAALHRRLAEESGFESVDLEAAESVTYHEGIRVRACPRCHVQMEYQVLQETYYCQRCRVSMTTSEAASRSRLVTPNEHWTNRPATPPPDLRTRRLRTRKD